MNAMPRRVGFNGGSTLMRSMMAASAMPDAVMGSENTIATIAHANKRPTLATAGMR